MNKRGLIMPEYNAPLRDMRFLLNEVFDAPKMWAENPRLAEVVDPDTADADPRSPLTQPLISKVRGGCESGCFRSLKTEEKRVSKFNTFHEVLKA